MSRLRPFHLAIIVDDLKKSRAFYGDLLGCIEGRSTDIWVDFNFFGHQLVCHKGDQSDGEEHNNPVDGKHVPVPHFGIVLSMPKWRQLRDKLLAAGIGFVIEPYIRFEGKAGEQATMFFYDPSGNALEFKAFKDIDAELFKK
ncbi:MAG: VOC family protein [Alcanivoracaceae bacterium]|nr:VOC family protein [Alcanivoracaceae bacterium]